MSVHFNGKPPTNVTFEAWFYPSGVVAFYDSHGKSLGISKWEELPPHGDLVDRDELSKSLNRLCDRVCQYSKAQRKVMCGSCPLGDAFAVVEDDATTIIEAEGVHE